jgi:type I restriction enzyme S subunit
VIVPNGFLFSADRNLAAIRVVRELIFPEYLSYALNAPGIQKQLKKASGSTAQPHLYLRDIKNLIVPVPPMLEQRIIIEEIDEKLSNCARLQQDVGSAFSVLGSLRQSILKAAFAGRLVPQDRDDEPASVLLERIRAERATRPKPARGRRRKTGAGARQLELLG